MEKPSFEKEKIGYIKINSTQGQITFCAFEIRPGILCEIEKRSIVYERPNIHQKTKKKNNIIHLNIKPDLFMNHATKIKQHISMLIKVFLNLNINDFKIILHKYK